MESQQIQLFTIGLQEYLSIMAYSYEQQEIATAAQA